MSKVTDILNFPPEWPSSFPQPEAGTRVLTYVFDPKYASKVELLLTFIKTTYPDAKLSVVKDAFGYISVTITQVADYSQPEEPLDANALIAVANIA